MQARDTARVGLGRGGRGVVGHELQGATRGRPRSRALEPAPPRQRTASALCDPGPARGARTHRGGDRLLEGGPGPDRSVRGCALHAARDRRIRTLRHPGSAASGTSRSTPRTSSSPCWRNSPPPARPRRARSPRRSRSTGSTPRRRTHGSPDRLVGRRAAVRREVGPPAKGARGRRGGPGGE